MILKSLQFKYNSGIEAITLGNSQGHITVLPYFGQMIWDVEFRQIKFKMYNFYDEPKNVNNIIDTYGCFAFHSGLLANGCPAPEDNHPMHGEFSCAKMDSAWLEVTDDAITLYSQYNYRQGFGYFYTATPSVTIYKNSGKFKIHMEVTNHTSFDMPLQYMCHINYNYVKNGVIQGNVPTEAFKIRESVPAHIKPTAKWYEYIKELKENPLTGDAPFVLADEKLYDPEIVFMADDLPQYVENARFTMTTPEGDVFCTEFSTKDFDHATRWLLYNGDQKVAAFVLPATCRPEGFKAAEKAQTLKYLKPGETKKFTVYTGLEEK